MFGIGMGHLLLLSAIALIAIGPKQLPEVARLIGRFINDMKRVRDEFTRSMHDTGNDIRQDEVVPTSAAGEIHHVPHFPVAPPTQIPELPLGPVKSNTETGDVLTKDQNENQKEVDQ